MLHITRCLTALCGILIFDAPEIASGAEYVTPISSGAAGNCSTDDSAAIASAASQAESAKRIVLIDRCYYVAATEILPAANLKFSDNGFLVIGPAATMVISGAVDAGPTAYIFRGEGNVSITNASWVSVAWWGALVKSDFGPPIRAAVGSHRTIYIPPATYTFLLSVPPGSLPAANATGVFIAGFSDFAILADGATFKVADSTASTTFTHFSFYNDKNFSVRGGTFTGNRSGLSPDAENGGIFLVSTLDATFEGQIFDGNYGGLGAPYAGDYNLRLKISNNRMIAAGIGFDFAFNVDLLIEDVTVAGVGPDGATGAGDNCFSNAYDEHYPPKYNVTGIPIEDTARVSIKHLRCSNFSTGVALASGSHIRIEQSSLCDNPGGGSAKGIGIYIFYNESGAYTSIGHPVTDVSIADNIICGNGATVPGYGLLIDGSAIRNNDRISNIAVTKNVFADNNDTGVGVVGVSTVSNIVIAGDNIFRGNKATISIVGGPSIH